MAAERFNANVDYLYSKIKECEASNKTYYDCLFVQQMSKQPKSIYEKLFDSQLSNRCKEHKKEYEKCIKQEYIYLENAYKKNLSHKLIGIA